VKGLRRRALLALALVSGLVVCHPGQIVREQFQKLAHESFCSQHDLRIDARGSYYDWQRRQQSHRQHD
jgi:hypothetical protein